MATYKQIGIAAALIAAAGAVATLELSRQRALRREIASLSEQTAPLPALRAENQRLRAARKSLVAGQAKASAIDPASGKANGAGIPSGAVSGPGGGPVKRKALLLDQQAVLLDRVAPTYPADLLGTGISGAVTVEFITNADDGSVTSAFAVGPEHASTGESVFLTPDFVPKSSTPQFSGPLGFSPE